MNLKIIPIAMMAMTIAGGAAIAQTTTDPSPVDPSAADKQTSLSDATIIGGMYTDEAMLTLRPAEEIKAAWQAMSEENRNQVTEDCKTPASPREQDLCGNLTGL